MSTGFLSDQEYGFLWRTAQYDGGFPMHSWIWSGGASCGKLFPRVKRAGILAAGDGLAVDLPEGGVFFNQFKAALAKRPDIHQSLDEGKEQGRGGL